MKIATWLRDSHGLFDYESTNLIKKAFSTHHTRYIIRGSDGDVKLVNEQEVVKPEGEISVLFKIIPNSDPNGKCIYSIQ